MERFGTYFEGAQKMSLFTQHVGNNFQLLWCPSPLTPKTMDYTTRVIKNTPKNIIFWGPQILKKKWELCKNFQFFGIGAMLISIALDNTTKVI